ncbi:hypothetical protein G7046_g7907 [Stylonectria norvegica]|nr:hypothetical protein G7046_g7907 [Stylonectria norvegica]
MSQVISLVAPSKALTPVPSSPMELDDDHHGRDRDRDRDGDGGDAVVRAATDPPDSPRRPRSAGLARKRAASINTSEANYARLEQLNINTPGIMSGDGSKDLICLCAPAPKIPRPRNGELLPGSLLLRPQPNIAFVEKYLKLGNAFILYRQHHQAQVVAQNPALPNPEISKIIGEKWKEEEEVVKGNWKALADEEKQRHQLQYPDYRYQPRRGGKGPAARPGLSLGEEGARCPKCQGRSIATPRTPSTPYATPTAARPSMHPFTPTFRGDDAEMTRRGSYGGFPPGSLRYTPQHAASEYGPESPEMKRRRYNSAGSYHSVNSPNPIQEAFGRQTGPPMRRGPATATPQVIMRQYASALPPETGMVTRSKSGPMAPPPRPSATGPWAEQGRHPGRHASYDESLRLPPLQTSVPMSPSMAGEVDIRQITTPVTGLSTPAGRDPQARSIEAMVMSIPFTRKLAVLSRISQPLAPPRPGSPGPETRGAIIAVEGPKPRMLQQVGQVVEKALLTSDDIVLRTWENHSLREQSSGDSPRPGDDKSSAESLNFFATYFETMRRWHEKSQEIVKHITSRHGSSPELPETKKEPRRRSLAEASQSPEPPAPSPAGKIPVALLKEGFSLTLSDMFACVAPIVDSYAPVDHWQWMATLWRGVVGPDLVVYVKPSVEDEIAKLGTVDFQKRPGMIVVRIPVGKDLDEATERRVSFEVIEWMRGGTFREGYEKAL